MRRVIVVAPQKNDPHIIQTAATTWGQLKDALQRDLGDLKNYLATTKDTKTSLVSADALLPTGDFTLFLTQTKIQAGNQIDLVGVIDALKEEFSNGFDNIITRVEAGEFDVRATTPARPTSTISAEDAAIFRQLQESLGTAPQPVGGR